MNPITETQNEAQEIITNATRDLRGGVIELWQWWDLMHMTLTHVYGVMMGYGDDQ